MIADLDRANGWVEFDPAPPPAPVEVVIEDEPEPVIEKPKKPKKPSDGIPDFLK